MQPLTTTPAPAAAPVDRAAAYHVRFSPTGPDEEHLVANLALCEQRKAALLLALDEIRQMKLEEHAAARFPHAEMYLEDLQGPKVIWNMERQVDAIDRIWFRSLEKLQRLQKQRQTAAAEVVRPEPPQPPEPPARAAEPPVPAPPPPVPAAPAAPRRLIVVPLPSGAVLPPGSGVPRESVK